MDKIALGNGKTLTFIETKNKKVKGLKKTNPRRDDSSFKAWLALGIDREITTTISTVIPALLRGRVVAVTGMDNEQQAVIVDADNKQRVVDVCLLSSIFKDKAIGDEVNDELLKAAENLPPLKSFDGVG